MKNTVFLLLFFFSLTGCSESLEIIDKDDSAISDAPLEGSVNGTDFVMQSALATEAEMFEDLGYMFHVFENEETCSDNIQVYSGDAKFFVVSESVLEPGEYEGKGPYFTFETEGGSTSSSYMGCTVIIDEVSDNMISGKVRGGSEDDGTYIEGAFDAILCN